MKLLQKGETDLRIKIRDGISIAGIGREDMRILYQNYRLKRLPWDLPFDLEPKEVLSQAQELISRKYPYAWSVRDGAVPLMMVFASILWDAICLDSPIFSPKASKRRIFEGSVTLIDQLRKEAPLLICGTDKQKSFLEKLNDRKLIRTTGHYLFQARIP
jgi:hypothetical protein